jgi:type IV secretion system protein TrbI
MSNLPRDEPASGFGIDALVDAGTNGPAPGTRWQPAPRAALRRDLHWWVGGGLLLLALPMLVWQSIGTDVRTGMTGDATKSRTAATSVRPPDSTSALERTIDDQLRVGQSAAFPPLPPLPPGAGRLQLSPMPMDSGPAYPPAAGQAVRPAGASPERLGAASAPSRMDVLAAEQERRVAEARSSPLLAIGSAGGGGMAAGAGAHGPALASMLQDAARGTGERPPAAAAAPVDPAPGFTASMSADARSDGAWLEQLRTRRTNDGGPVATQRQAPSGPVLLEGTVIPAVLLTEINSDLPGTLVAQVTQDIWDSVHGKYLLVPRGARLVGEYNSDVRPGQERVLAAFRRLILPDGSSLDLLGTQATDAQGRSGLHDRVDRHFWTMFGSSFMVAALASLVQRREAQPSTVIVVPGSAGGTASALSSAAGSVLVDTSRAILGRSRNIPPTLMIGQGHRFSLTVQRTLLLIEKESGNIFEVSR